MLNPSDSTSQLHNRKEGLVEFDLPDELAVEILSRLPATDVVRLRSVCKRWKDITSSQNFTLLHLRRCIRMILFEDHSYDEWEHRGCDHYLLDLWWDPRQATHKSYQFGKHTMFDALFSHVGLVVMTSDLDYMIMNLIYHERVQITLSDVLRGSEIYGVFFHPSLKEFCTLWRIIVSGEVTGPSVKRHEYRLLTLGSKPCWRVIDNPWSHIARIRPIPPVLIDEHLYWVVEPEVGFTRGMSFPADIMEFDIRKEEFTFISSPVPRTYRCSEANITLLDIGGFLSLVWTSPSEDPPITNSFEVNIWTLKDHARQLWMMSSYRINTDGFYSSPTPVALVNDVLVLHERGELFTCNLKLGTRKFLDDFYNIPFFANHVMSLVSLRNCKSKIYMDKKGEVKKNRKRRR